MGEAIQKSWNFFNVSEWCYMYCGTFPKITACSSICIQICNLACPFATLYAHWGYKTVSPGNWSTLWNLVCTLNEDYGL